MCRIPITSGMDFVDPESVKLAFTFRNTDGSSDMLCGSPDPSCFIERIQLFANGQRVEDINYYGRSCFMYSLLKPESWWKELHWQGLPVDAGGWAQPVQPGQKRDVLMYPHLLGMFTAGKMLPPQLNLVIEIEFADPEHAMARRRGLEFVLPDRKREAFGRPGHPGQRPAGVLRAHPALEPQLVFSFPSLHVQQSSVPADSTSYNITVARAFHETAGSVRDLEQNGRKLRLEHGVTRVKPSPMSRRPPSWKASCSSARSNSLATASRA